MDPKIHSYQVHLWSARTAVLAMVDFKDDRAAAVKKAQNELTTTGDRPTSFEGEVRISPDTLTIHGLGDGVERFDRNNFIWMTTTNIPAPMITVVLKRSTAVELELLVLELESKFEMLQLRSDFEVMKLGMLPSRTLVLVPGKASKHRSFHGSSSTDSPLTQNTADKNAKTQRNSFAIIDGSTVPLRNRQGRNDSGPVAEGMISSSMQWARRSIVGVWGKLRPSNKGQASIVNPVHVRTDQSPLGGAKGSVLTPTANSPVQQVRASTSPDLEHTHARSPNTKIPTFSRNRWSLRGKGRSRSATSDVESPPASPSLSPYRENAETTETSIDAALNSHGEAQLARKESVKVARSRKIEHVIKQFNALPTDAKIEPKDIDRYIKYNKAHAHEMGRAQLQERITVVIREEREAMKRKAKQQISAIRAHRMGEAVESETDTKDKADGGENGKQDDSDDDNDNDDGYLQMGEDSEDTHETNHALDLYHNGNSVSGAQLKLIVNSAMVEVNALIEQQNRAAIQQVRLQTQMRTRQELLQKMAQMRRSKKRSQKKQNSASRNTPRAELPAGARFAPPAGFLGTDSPSPPSSPHAEPVHLAKTRFLPPPQFLGSDSDTAGDDSATEERVVQEHLVEYETDL